MSACAFEAWCLPGGVDPPGLAEPSEGGESSFRLLAIDPDWLDGLIDALANAREGLRGLGAAQLAKVLGQAGSRFMDDDDPLRQEALDRLPATSGLSAEMCRTVLDGMAANWSEGRLTTLLVDELGGPQPLDGFVDQGGPQTMAVGARLCVQIASGSVPGVGVDALIRSLLTKAPTLLKPGLGDVVLPVLFARALKEVDPSVAAGLAVVYWPGGDGALERTALTRADLVTIYGSDETVRGLRALAPVTARLVVYHHRTSVGVVGRAALAARVAGATASDIANAVALFDQRGCVSPQVIWVEEGGEVTPSAFAAELAKALEAAEGALPGGRLTKEEASAVQQLRGTAELMAASGAGVDLHHGGVASWTVVLDPGGGLEASCIGRVVRVVPIASASDLPGHLAPYAPHLQTVGVAGLGDRLGALAEKLASVGVTRIAPFSAVPFPTASWHHDGGGPLRDLLRWVDLEGGS